MKFKHYTELQPYELQIMTIKKKIDCKNCKYAFSYRWNHDGEEHIIHICGKPKKNRRRKIWRQEEIGYKVWTDDTSTKAKQCDLFVYDEKSYTEKEYNDIIEITEGFWEKFINREYFR